jgi:hypothetical protein
VVVVVVVVVSVSVVVVVAVVSIAFESVVDLHWPWYFAKHHPPPSS